MTREPTTPDGESVRWPFTNCVKQGSAGKMDEWVKIMEEEIIPFQGFERHGHLRQLPGRDRRFPPNVWLRRFESEAEREALYKAV